MVHSLPPHTMDLIALHFSAGYQFSHFSIIVITFVIKFVANILENKNQVIGYCLNAIIKIKIVMPHDGHDCTTLYFPSLYSRFSFDNLCIVARCPCSTFFLLNLYLISN